MEQKPTSKKLNKSTKYYFICGAIAFSVVFTLLLIYALVTHIDILAWFGSKYALITLGAIIIYTTIGVILAVRDKIGRM